MSESDLLRNHVATLFVLDETGDLVSSNEPYAPWRRPAPFIFLSWSDDDYACCFRYDVPDKTREAVQEVIAGNWPFPGAEQPPELEKIKALLIPQAPKGRSDSGPAYIFASTAEPECDAILVDSDNTDVLLHAYSDNIPAIEYVQPCYCVLEASHAVSICQTVRRWPGNAEAGLDTLPSHKSKGYAVRAAAAWGCAVRAAGDTAWYSTSWDNKASQRVAEKLGLMQIAVEWSLR